VTATPPRADDPRSIRWTAEPTQIFEAGAILILASAAVVIDYRASQHEGESGRPA
jgi:hypothetical protein